MIYLPQGGYTDHMYKHVFCVSPLSSAACSLLPHLYIVVLETVIGSGCSPTAALKHFLAAAGTWSAVTVTAAAEEIALVVFIDKSIVEALTAVATIPTVEVLALMNDPLGSWCHGV